MAAFDQCVDTGKASARVRKDMAEAQELQVKGTPTFFLGHPSGSQVKATRMVGAQPYQVFKDAIERLLSSQK